MHCHLTPVVVTQARVRRLVGAATVAMLAAALLVIPVSSAQSAAETTTLGVSGDTYLRSGVPNTNEGGSSFLRVRASGDNRALVRFDQAALVATVGSGTLVSASLELSITANGDNWGASGRTISVFRLTKEWVEGNGFVDGGLPPSRGSGEGATWACAVDSDIADVTKDCSGATEWEMGMPSQPLLHPWVEPSTATVLITNGLSGTVSFDVTADVQAFLSGSVPNDGWIVKKDVEGAAGLVELASREAGNGPRLVLTVDRAPADTDEPFVQATGLSSFSPPGEFTRGGGEISIDVVSSDAGSGIRAVSVVAGETELAAAPAACDPGCPFSFATVLSFDTSSLADGRHDLVPRARDGVGNIGAGEQFALWVDRVSPSAITDVRLARFGGTTATFAWAEAADPPLVGGDLGSGVQEYSYRYRVGSGAWSDLMTTDVPEFDLDNAALGDVVDIEVSAIDAVGNVGPTTAATLTVFAADEPAPWYSDPNSNPAPEVTLTPTQVSQATSAALEDPRIAALLDGLAPRAEAVIPWSTAFTTSSVVGADVTLAWDTPVTLETDWPLASFAEDGQSYTLDVVRFRATSVSSLSVLVTFDPLEVVAFDVVDGDVDPDSIEPASSSPPSTLGAAVAVAATPEGAGDDRNAYNVYRLSRKLLPELGSDVFWNWDFREAVRPVRPQMTAEADWPVAVIFTGQVSVDVAKQIWPGRRLQSPMWALVKDEGPHPSGRVTTTTSVWDRDEGAYLGASCIGHKWHYRAYAPSPRNGGDDRMYNLTLGYYVVATVHQDHRDPDPGGRVRCLPNPWHGGTDVAEEKLARAAEDYIDPLLPLRFDAEANWFNLRNYDERGRRGRRVYDSDGWATRICARLDDGWTPCQGEF